MCLCAYLCYSSDRFWSKQSPRNVFCVYSAMVLSMVRFIFFVDVLYGSGPSFSARTSLRRKNTLAGADGNYYT